MTKKENIIAKCKKNEFEFEQGNFEYGHKYNIWFNSKTGSKEILCKNLDECNEAIIELIEIKQNNL